MKWLIIVESLNENNFEEFFFFFLSLAHEFKINKICFSHLNAVSSSLLSNPPNDGIISDWAEKFDSPPAEANGSSSTDSFTGEDEKLKEKIEKKKID